MRIGIDARSLHYEGVGRYIRELIKHLTLIDSKNEYIIYFSSEKSIAEESIKSSNFHSKVLSVSIYDLHKQPYFWYRIYQDNLDIFHATNHWLVPFFTPCPLIITVHDTLTKNEKKRLSYKVKVYGTLITRMALACSSRILTISDFTKQEIINLYPAARQKISVIYHGVGREFTRQSETEVVQIKKKYRLTKRYLLYVGSLKVHKNIPKLIEAFSQLPLKLKEETDLVIAARLEQKFSRVMNLPSLLGIEKHVRFIGYVPTEDLSGLYSGAVAFVMPSFTEWFGLPVIEAMACGTPVIASRGGALPEVCGQAASYFNPESVEDMRNVIEHILTDNELQEWLSNMGVKRSEEFSWDITARKTLGAYEEVYKQR
ncbi:MAG: glycosyltransferase family 1 protein [wastewater metagenome]|nr:glycosyltransferase family 1 protein [Candidatus Loosdrechtia aerotolerans]